MLALSPHVLIRLKQFIKNENPRKFKKFDAAPLARSGDAEVEKLKNILVSLTTDHSWLPAEMEQFQKVAAIKNAYLESDTRVTIKDYGAGPKKALYTKEKMEAGADKTVVISKTVQTDATPEKWGKLLFKMVRDFKCRHCLELGTNLGISAAYQLAAQQLNGSGHLTTIEGAAPYAALAEKSLHTLQYPHFKVLNGRFSDVLPTVLSADKPIDFAFIDGHHDGAATQNYFDMLYPYLAPKAVLVFDDIYWSADMKNAWTNLYRNPKIKASVDLRKWGICLVDKTATTTQPQYFKVDL